MNVRPKAGKSLELETAHPASFGFLLNQGPVTSVTSWASASKEHPLHFDPGSLSLKKIVNRLPQHPLGMLVLNKECL